MGFFTWCGRVTLWLIFWPLGLWRSYRHGQERRTQRIIAANQTRTSMGRQSLPRRPPPPPPPPPY